MIKREMTAKRPRKRISRLTLQANKRDSSKRIFIVAEKQRVKEMVVMATQSQTSKTNSRWLKNVNTLMELHVYIISKSFHMLDSRQYNTYL